MIGEEHDVAIRHLFEVPEAAPVLAAWFVDEWEPYYGPQGPGDATADLLEARSRDGIPICLVALHGSMPLGTIALKAASVSHPSLGPWVVAFLVGVEHRGRGVGRRLLEAIEAEARRLGYDRIYVSTDTAIRMIERRGWRSFDTADTLRGEVGVYRLDMADEVPS